MISCTAFDFVAGFHFYNKSLVFFANLNTFDKGHQIESERFTMKQELWKCSKSFTPAEQTDEFCWILSTTIRPKTHTRF